MNSSHQSTRVASHRRDRKRAENQTRQGPREHDELRSLKGTLDVLEHATSEREKLSLGEALDAVGQYSFAPLLLLPGLIMALPGPADIPGVPVILGALVVIVAVQMVLKREHLWVPHWMEKRQLGSETVK